MTLQEIRAIVSKAVCTNIGIPYDEGGAAALAAIDELISNDDQRNDSWAETDQPMSGR